MVPMALNSRISPNHTTDASWPRSRKASWKVRKPTVARTMAIPDAARTTPDDRSSSRSSAPAGVAATTTRRSRVARPRASRYSSTARHRVTRTSMSFSSTAGSTTTTPAMPGQQPELGVGLHQLGVVRDHGGHQGALGDGVGLGQHEEHEAPAGTARGVSRFMMRNTVTMAPAEAGQDHHQPPPAPHAVQRRAEDAGPRWRTGPWSAAGRAPPCPARPRG